MRNEYKFILRSTYGANQGQGVAEIPTEAWLYFNLNMKVNDIGFMEGIISRCYSDFLTDVFDVTDENGVLDFVLEVYRKPVGRIRNQLYHPMELLSAYPVRYYRTEWLNDGRPRDTVITRSPLDFLRRPVVYPPGPIPPVVDNNNVIPAFPWPLPTAETFDGLGAGNDTKIQMENLVQYCSLNTPEPFGIVNVPAPTAGGGIADHRIALRYDNLLKVLQEMSASSWYANFYGIEVGLPIDFDLVYDPLTATYTYTSFVGGLDLDKRIGNGVNQEVIFAPVLDNVIQPVSISDRRNEITQAIVAGQGQDVNRDIIRVLNNDLSGDSPFNLIEKYVNQGKLPAFAPGIQDALVLGRRSLRENGYRHDLTVVPRQNSSTVFGIDYNLGTLVSVSFDASQEDRQITEVDIKLFNHGAEKTGGSGRGSHEQITLGLSPLNGRRHEGSKGLKRILEILADSDKELEEQIDEIGSTQ